MGAGVGLGHPRLVGVGADLPHPLGRAARDRDRDHRAERPVRATRRCPSVALPPGRPRPGTSTIGRSLTPTPTSPDPVARARAARPCHGSRRRPTADPGASSDRSPAAMRAAAVGCRSCRSPSRSSRSSPAAALFLSGYSLGPAAASQPGTPVTETQAFQPFWDTYHSITDTLRRRRGGPRDAHPGRDQGDDRRARRPVLLVPDSEEYRESLQGISGQFEGIGAEIGTQAADGTPGLRDARAGLPSRDHQRRSTGRRPRRPACWPATSSSPPTASRSTA